MSDFFHPGADEWREHYWHTIYDTPQHLYLILTKRPERIPGCLPDFGKKEWPWPHVWLGTSVECVGEKRRLVELQRVPAALRWLSIEPLLEDLGDLSLAGISWVVCGGESGPGARPMHPDWARGVRDQCKAAAVPFFFKQWGEWSAGSKIRSDPDFAGGECFDDPRAGGTTYAKFIREHTERGQLLKNYRLMEGDLVAGRVGKKRAGRLLDGREWSEFPI
jgi:protein gp37